MRLHPEGDTGDPLQEGYAPARWIVPPGRYRITVTEVNPFGTTISGDTFTLSPGEALTHTLQATLGTLVVEAMNADRVTLYVFSTEDTPRFLGQFTAGLPQVYLPPGVYNVRVEDARNTTRQVWLEGVQVTAETPQVIRVRLP